MKHLLALAVLSTASCVAGYDEPPVEDYVVEETSADHLGGWHKDNGPVPESCGVIYKGLPNGLVMRIPVECHPIIANPYGDEEDWENPSEQLGRPQNEL